MLDFQLFPSPLKITNLLQNYTTLTGLKKYLEKRNENSTKMYVVERGAYLMLPHGIIDYTRTVRAIWESECNEANQICAS